jgi:hypothetical protein
LEKIVELYLYDIETFFSKIIGTFFFETKINIFFPKKNGNFCLRKKPGTSPKDETVKKEWKPKCENKGLIAHTSLRASSRED